MDLKTYCWNVFRGFDRTLNAIIGGDPDETLSSVAYRKHRDGGRWKGCEAVINWLFSWQSDHHCLAAYNHDRVRKLAP